LEYAFTLDPLHDLKNRNQGLFEEPNYDGLHIEYDDFGNPNKLVIAELGEGCSFVDSAVVW